MSASASTILDSLAAAGNSYGQNHPGSRERILDLSSQLIAALELPSEFIQRSFWAEPAKAAHCRIAVDLKIFQHLKEAQNGISVNELARKTGADLPLIARIMNHLSAMHLVHSSEGTFHASPLSSGLAEQMFSNGICYTYDVAGPSFRKLPEYLKSIEYRNPTSIVDGPFQYAHNNTQLPFFAWLDANPPYLSQFNSYMAAYRAGKANWCDAGFYAVAERLVHDFDPASNGEVFLVDVGGGMGHDLVELASKHSDLPGKLILQDRAEVISAVAENAAFTPQVHDFFTPQPVKGARAYYLHSVLHDWGDEDCVRILEALKPAIVPGYSRVLINEIVVADERPTLAATAMDQLVFALGAMRERTETEWRALLERAGMRIVKIYTYPGVAESLIEAELA